MEGRGPKIQMTIKTVVEKGLGEVARKKEFGGVHKKRFNGTGGKTEGAKRKEEEEQQWEGRALQGGRLGRSQVSQRDQ